MPAWASESTSTMSPVKVSGGHSRFLSSCPSRDASTIPIVAALQGAMPTVTNCRGDPSRREAGPDDGRGQQDALPADVANLALADDALDRPERADLPSADGRAAEDPRFDHAVDAHEHVLRLEARGEVRAVCRVRC